jgi:FKBP-type peptidyl-prolyl cis-trans isomerase FkpA
MSVTAVPLRPIKKGSVLKLWAALGLLSAAAGGLAWAGTSGQQVETTASGLRYQVVEAGQGDPITSQDLVALAYEGRTPNGEVFDSSARSGQPLVTGPGDPNMIPGFTEAVGLMKEKSVYRIWIPPALGYKGRVPPGAPFGANDTLEFRVEVLQVARGMAAMQRMMGPGGGAAPQPQAPPPSQ